MSSSSPPASPTTQSRIARYLPSGRAWWLVAGAFLAGLLLFALVLSGKRDEFEFYRAEGGRDAQLPGQVFDPLPAPLPAGEDAASGMDQRAPERSEAPRIDQHAASPADTTAAAPATTSPTATPGVPSPGVAGDASIPRPLSAPPPDYPSRALRAGVSGDVTLRIEVDADGRPGEIEVVGSSRNRDLDRAAVQAVRRWRFQPAMRAGVPVAGHVQQVISFDAPR